MAAAKSRLHRSVCAAAAGASVMSLCGWAVQQSPRLQPVDPGVGDTGPLSVSERLMPADLRVPSAFERVYRLSGDDGKFARVSGAITAVFPRSQYVRTEAGLVPEIPAGTVFYIGTLPEDRRLFRDSGVRRPQNYVETSARDLVLSGRMPPVRAEGFPVAVAPARQAPSIFTDDLYRRMRVAELLDRAVVATADR